MAQRRMTSLDVIDTDAFLEMPVSSQLLYFHLNARADDDGFVANPNRIIKTVGTQTDDLKLLIAKKFVIAFNDGVCVIKHWRINNFVRKDIYRETKYLDHKQALYIRANGAYTLTEDDRALKLPNGHFQMEDVNKTLTKRQLRLGKGSEGKESIKSAKAEFEGLEIKPDTEHEPTHGRKKDGADSAVEARESKIGRKFGNHSTQVKIYRSLLSKKYTQDQIEEEYDYQEKKHPGQVDYIMVAHNIHKEH